VQGEPDQPHGLPKPVIAFMWLLIGLGVVQVVAAMIGMVLTRTFQLWPMLLIGIGDTAISATFLWALKRIAS
jgi:hypothetical protein